MIGDFYVIFYVIFGEFFFGTILRQNPNIYGQFQGKLGFGQFWKKKSLGQIPNFYQKIVLEASLSTENWRY